MLLSTQWVFHKDGTDATKAEDKRQMTKDERTNDVTTAQLLDNDRARTSFDHRIISVTMAMDDI